MDREIVLKVNGLKKSYKNHTVLDGVNMTIYKGDIYGFVGRNGAGKTTLIRAIAGLIYADEGDFELLGIKSNTSKINQARRHTCSMVESPSIYPELSAHDNMKAQCLILNKPFDCIAEKLVYVGLENTGRKPAGNFSLGMRQRLYIAMSLISDPEFMLLDEPINGLDPEGIKSVRELLTKLNQEKGITILISSHILTELGLLATRYGFIDKGKMIREVTTAEINRATAMKSILTVTHPEKAMVCLHKLGYEAYVQEGKIYTERDIDLMKTCRAFDEAGVYLNHYDSEAMELEDYFINLIGGNK